MIPTNLSNRYPHFLVARGSNAHFTIVSIVQAIAKTPGGLPMGHYFIATIHSNVGFEEFSGEGLTPVSATKQALIHAGSTFR